MRNKMKTMIIAARAEKPKDMPVHVSITASTKLVDGKKVKMFTVSSCCLDKPDELFTNPDDALAAVKKHLMAKPKPEDDEDEYEMED